MKYAVPVRSQTQRKVLTTLKPYLYLAPMLVLAAGFAYYPFFRTLLNAFSVVNAKGQITGWAGLENVQRLFAKPLFLTALVNSLKLTALNVPITLVLSLSLALLSSKKRALGGVYESMFMLPMAISMTVTAMVFKVLLNPTVGFLNHALGIQVGWFTDKKVALYGILQVTVWMGVAFDYLLFLSAVRGLPEELLEAARIDGAGYFTRLFHIALPLLSPTIFYVVCTNLTLAMMTSGPVMIITQGGPSRSTTTLLYLMFTSGYGSSDYSLAACISLVAFGLTFGFTALAFFIEKKGVHYT